MTAHSERTLVGLTKAEAKKLLGPPDSTLGESRWTYHPDRKLRYNYATEKWDFLYVFFHNGVITSIK